MKEDDKKEFLIKFMYWFNEQNAGSETDWIDIEEIEQFLEETDG